VVDLTGDDNEEDDLLFQSGNDFFHIEEGIERARQVAAAVAMAALVSTATNFNLDNI
jgi:hypothetical protein